MATVVVLTAGLWILGFAVFFRMPLCQKRPAAAAHRSLSVIIPARNEENALPRLLSSLDQQRAAVDEMIVVDDGSTDRTADIAAAAGARVLPCPPLPPGWRGKPWACFQGADAATGDLLMFVDADTTFAEHGLGRILDTYAEQDGVLSINPYHTVTRPHEQLSAFFNLMTTIGVGAFHIGTRGGASSNGLFGPFMLLDRATYDAVGGHAPVKDKILENFHLAQHFRAHGVSLRCFGGKGALQIRMYPHGIRELINGWRKAFADGAAATPPGLLVPTVLWITGSMLAFIFLLLSLTGLTDHLSMWLCLYCLYAVQMYWMFRRLGSFSLWTACLYPVPLVTFFVIFSQSVLAAVRKQDVAWKGRGAPVAADAEEHDTDAD